MLYWDFLFRNRTRLRGNQRMSLVLANADRLDAREREAITRQARRLRKSLGVRLT